MCKSSKYFVFSFGLLQVNFDKLQQAEHFCNSIGILQQFAPPSKFPNFDRSGSQTPQQQTQEDYVQLFTTLIARSAKDIDTLIESLPSEESSTELQVTLNIIYFYNVRCKYFY